MSVPSYEDLTPGIPDVVDAETPMSIASLFRDVRWQLSAAGSPLPAAGSRLSALGCQLSASDSFACVRLKADSREPEAGSREPAAGSRQLAAILAIARDFSPRVKRAGDAEVLLDVSGLGRLIGPPDEIARQLSRALADAGVAATVAIAPTMTVARLLATQPDASIARFHDCLLYTSPSPRD